MRCARADAWSSFGRIPPRVEMDDGIGSGQVQTETPRFETDEKDWDGTIGLKTLDHGLPVGSRAVQITILDVFRRKLLLQKSQHADELAEDQQPMTAVNDFLEQF